MNPIPSLIEEMAKALAFASVVNRPDMKLRWPEGPDDRISGRDGSVPFGWDFVVECRRQAQAIVTHLADFDSFDYAKDVSELELAAFDIDCGLTYPSTPLTFAFRRAVCGEGADSFLSPGYQWTDKPHRLVYSLCGEVERQAHLIAEQHNALVKCLALIDDMSRFVGKMSLNDYALFNEAPMLARVLVEKSQVTDDAA
jgi:hypothetical protein